MEGNQKSQLKKHHQEKIGFNYVPCTDFNATFNIMVLNHNFHCLQMISPTARRVSPPESSASTFPPWRRTPPTYSEPSFEPSGSPTPVPRETSRGLSSTRCVNWPFIPNVSTAQGGWRAQFLSRVPCRWVRKMKTFILGCPAVPLSSFHALIIIPCATAKWILHQETFKSFHSRLWEALDYHLSVAQVSI